MTTTSPSRRAISAALGRISPRHREWRALLRSCTLTAETAGRSLDDRDFIICGCPRSGTALATAALFQAPESVTVMEPWRALQHDLPKFFADTRQTLTETGQLIDGRLRVDALEESGAVAWQRDAEHRYDAPTHGGTRIGLKWPTFWQLLGIVDARFVVCVRDPAEVVQSFENQGARLAQGLEYDLAFNQSLNERLERIDDLESRRLALYDEANSRVLDHSLSPTVYILRYERWFSDRDGVLTELSEFLGFDATGSHVRVISPRSRISASRRLELRRRSTTASALGYAAT